MYVFDDVKFLFLFPSGFRVVAYVHLLHVGVILIAVNLM